MCNCGAAHHKPFCTLILPQAGYNESMQAA
jgi:hypothetical protein